MRFEDIIDWAAAYVIFGLIVLGFAGFFILVALFASLALRAAWRWLSRHTWNRVIVSVERKALRARRI